MKPAAQAGRAGAAPPPIELRVGQIGQLFHTLDPLPFRERDLDEGVEAYVVGWARELPRGQPIHVVVHLPRAEASRAESRHIGDAMRRYFAYRAEAAGWELRELFRIGRMSLLIGLGVLGACVVTGRMVAGALGGGYAGRFLDEGLIILGWVASWRPVQIFLYDWWPIAGRRRLYRRLAMARVTVEPPVRRRGSAARRASGPSAAA